MSGVPHPEPGEFFELFRCGYLTLFRVEEWRGNRCFMTDGTSFRWSPTLGFVSW